jgi:hypothetical protein
MDAARCVGFQPTLAFGSGIGGLKCYDIKGGIEKCSVDRPTLTDQVPPPRAIPIKSIAASITAIAPSFRGG